MKNVKIGFIGGGNMGGAMIEALWRAQSDEAAAARSFAEDEQKLGGSEARGAENIAIREALDGKAVKIGALRKVAK